MPILKKHANTTLSDEFEKVLSLFAEERDADGAKFLSHEKAWSWDVENIEA